MTDGQSASLSWNKAPILRVYDPKIFLLSDTCGFVDVVHPLCDERPGPPFTIAAGPHQRSHSRVPVLWDS
jgi:hypothetical protein